MLPERIEVESACYSPPELREYQHSALNFFVASPENGALLALQQGLGKTLITLSIFNRLKTLGLVDNMLVVAPLRVAKFAWPEEIDKWFPQYKYTFLHGTNKRHISRHLDKDIWLINYEGLNIFNPKKPNAEAKSLLAQTDKGTLLVLDESSYIRNLSNRTRMAIKLSMICKYKLLLSGTPAPKSVENLYYQIGAIDDGKRLGSSLGKMRSRWGRTVYNGFSNETKYSEEAIKNIMYEVTDVMLSMETRAHLNLPSVTHITKTFKLNETNRKKYDALENDMVLEIKGQPNVMPFNAGALSMKCRQFCSGFLYYEDEETLERKVERYHKQKIEVLKTIIEQCDEDPVLIFYNFQEELEMIKHAFPHVETLCANADANTIDRWNKKEIPLLAANPQSASHGLNLQYGGHLMVWYSLTFDLELYLQANARLDRSGQTKPVTIYVIAAENTVEERVSKSLASKDVNQKAILTACSRLRTN